MNDHFVYITDDLGESPISRAYKSGIPQAISLMMALEDEAQGLKTTSVPPAHEAARLGDAFSLKTVIEAGCDLDEQDEYGMTPLHWAAVNGCMDVARLLVNRGADLTVRAHPVGGFTPVELAHTMGYNQLHMYLLEHACI